MSRRKKAAEGRKDPAWLLTFSDLMTLLLTFFVLLLSMAVIDERAKRIVLGSVSQAFGISEQITSPLARKAENKNYEPGPMENKDDDLAPLRDMIIDDASKDLDFRENKYVQIFSINDEVLFSPGTTALKPEGMQMLDRILPYLQEMRYPLLVAGHTAARRDETIEAYGVDPDDKGMDGTWPLSFNRALAVYRHLMSRGIPPANLSLEAFGQYHARATNNTPEGRRKNRRVDLVLDKRNREWIDKVEALRQKAPEQTDHYYKGFRFDITLPSSPSGSPSDSSGGAR